MELAWRFEEFYNAQAGLPQEAKVYVKWTVAGLASSYVTVNSIFLASSTLDLDQSAVVFFLDNGKKFPASAIAHIQFFTKFSANCCKKREREHK